MSHWSWKKLAVNAGKYAICLPPFALERFASPYDVLGSLVLLHAYTAGLLLFTSSPVSRTLGPKRSCSYQVELQQVVVVEVLGLTARCIGVYLRKILRLVPFVFGDAGPVPRTHLLDEVWKVLVRGLDDINRRLVPLFDHEVVR